MPYRQHCQGLIEIGLANSNLSRGARCFIFSMRRTLLGMTENPGALPSKETSAKCGLTRLNWGDGVLVDFWGFGQSILTNAHFGQTKLGLKPSIIDARVKTFTSILGIKMPPFVCSKLVSLSLLLNWVTLERVLHPLWSQKPTIPIRSEAHMAIQYLLPQPIKYIKLNRAKLSPS